MKIIIALAIIHTFLFALTLLVVYQKAKKLQTWLPYALLIPFIPILHAILSGTDVNRLAMRRIQGGFMGCPRCRGLVCHPDCVNTPTSRFFKRKSLPRGRLSAPRSGSKAPLPAIAPRSSGEQSADGLLGQN